MQYNPGQMINRPFIFWPHYFIVQFNLVNFVLNTCIKDLAYRLCWVFLFNLLSFLQYTLQALRLLFAPHNQASTINTCCSPASSVLWKKAPVANSQIQKMAKLRSHLVSPKLRNSQLFPEGLGRAVFLIVREAEPFTL